MAGKEKFSWNIYDFIGAAEMQGIYISDFNHIIIMMKSIAADAVGNAAYLTFEVLCHGVFSMTSLCIGHQRFSYRVRRERTGLSPSNLHSTHVAVPMSIAML